MSNTTVIALNKFGKLARGCCVHVFLVVPIIIGALGLVTSNLRNNFDRHFVTERGNYEMHACWEQPGSQ